MEQNILATACGRVQGVGFRYFVQRQATALGICGWVKNCEDGSVRMLLQIGRRLERYVRPRRSREEQSLIDQAKRLLMDRNDMTEEHAHRYLQKKSMDSGAKLVQTAQLVLDSTEPE